MLSTSTFWITDIHLSYAFIIWYQVTISCIVDICYTPPRWNFIDYNFNWPYFKILLSGLKTVCLTILRLVYSKLDNPRSKEQNFQNKMYLEFSVNIHIHKMFPSWIQSVIKYCAAVKEMLSWILFQHFVFMVKFPENKVVICFCKCAHLYTVFKTKKFFFKFLAARL